MDKAREEQPVRGSGATVQSLLQRAESMARWIYREGRHALFWTSPARKRAWARWLSEQGPAFLSGLGIRPGDTVLDYGCGRGAYAVPAALQVGEKGRVVAVDVSGSPLRRLKRLAREKKWRNLQTIRGLDEMHRRVAPRSCQAVLLYDMLHILPENQRRTVYTAVREKLAKTGFLSVFPKHVRGDEPSKFFRNLTEQDLVREIEEAGVRLRERREAWLWHGHERVFGRILNFTKD